MKKKQLIGILNCTPDSYYEGGRHNNVEDAVLDALEMFESGADIVDIGGESTRPSESAFVSEEEELRRVIPVLQKIRQKSLKPLSIDTYKPKVAEKALEAGATILNDITGFSNPAMRKIAAISKAPLFLMHMQSPPHGIASFSYPKGIVTEICEFFKERIDLLLKAGVDTSQIILDPGIGGGSFGKTPEQSIEILKNIPTFCGLGFPILISLSRKSFLQKILSKPASETLSTTIALNTMSLLSGAGYIRVHDVGAHRDVLRILEKFDHGFALFNSSH